MEHQEDTQPKHRNSLWMQQDVYQKTQVDGIPVDVNYFKAIINPGSKINQVIINRPQLTYAEILHDIITEMPKRRISTVNIYDKVMEIYPYFKYATARWRNSINSVLSRNVQFRSVTYHDERGLPDRYWTIVESNNENDSKVMLENIISGVNTTNASSGTNIIIPGTSSMSPSSAHQQMHHHQQQQQPMSTSTHMPQHMPPHMAQHMTSHVPPHMMSSSMNPSQHYHYPMNNGVPIMDSGMRSSQQQQQQQQQPQHIPDTMSPYIMQNDFIDFCSRALGVNFSEISTNEEKLSMAYNQYIMYVNGVRNSTANVQQPPSSYGRSKFGLSPTNPNPNPNPNTNNNTNMVANNPYINMNMDWASSGGHIPNPHASTNDPTSHHQQFHYPVIGQALQQYIQYVPPNSNGNQQVNTTSTSPGNNTSSNAMNDSIGSSGGVMGNSVYGNYSTHPTDVNANNSRQFGSTGVTSVSMAFPNYGVVGGGAGYLVDDQQMQQFFPPNSYGSVGSGGGGGKENSMQHNAAVSVSPLSATTTTSTTCNNSSQQYQSMGGVRQHSNFPPLSQISNNTPQNTPTTIEMNNSLKNTPILENNFDANDMTGYDANNSAIDMNNQIIDR